MSEKGEWCTVADIEVYCRVSHVLEAAASKWGTDVGLLTAYINEVPLKSALRPHDTVAAAGCADCVLVVHYGAGIGGGLPSGTSSPDTPRLFTSSCTAFEEAA